MSCHRLNKETGKGLSAYDMKKPIPVWKQEHEWLKECYSQCLQQSVLNLSQAFINFFDGRAQYSTFKNRHGRQSIQYPQNVKIKSDAEIQFPGNLGTVKAKIHRDGVGKLKTVTVSRMTDRRYYASCRKNRTTLNRRKAKWALATVHSKISRVREDFLHKLSRKLVNENSVIVVEDLAVIAREWIAGETATLMGTQLSASHHCSILLSAYNFLTYRIFRKESGFCSSDRGSR